MFMFFGFMHSEEPSEKEYDPEVHLCYQDITVENHQEPTYLQVSVKESKTDPFTQGVMLYVGVTQSDLCPEATALSFMITRGNKPGWFSGDRMKVSHWDEICSRDTTRKQVTKQRNMLVIIFRLEHYSSKGSLVSRTLIKTLGHWESSAYISKPPMQSVSRKLVG